MGKMLELWTGQNILTYYWSELFCTRSNKCLLIYNLNFLPTGRDSCKMLDQILIAEKEFPDSKNL